MKKRFKRFLPALLVLILFAVVPRLAVAEEMKRQNLQVTYYDSSEHVIKTVRYYSDIKSREHGVAKKERYFGPNGETTHVIDTYTHEMAQKTGDYRRSTYFNREGRIARIERFHTQKKRDAEEIIKTISYLADTGRVNQIERISSPSKIKTTHIAKTVDILDKNGRLRQQILHYLSDPEDIRPSYSRTIDFNENGERTRLTRLYRNRESNELGYFKSVFYYDQQNRKVREEWVMTEAFRREKQIERMIFHFDERGAKIKQEVVPTESGALRHGVARTVFLYDNRGSKSKRVRYYTAETRLQKGYHKGVTYYNEEEDVVREEIYDRNNRLLKLNPLTETSAAPLVN